MTASLALKHMNDIELQLAIKNIVGAVCVISGCQIEPMLMQTTLTTVKKFLTANYGFLTVDEIQEAFQMNAVGSQWRRIQHYNRSLNCDYIGEVLQAFNEYRSQLMPDLIAAHNRVVPSTPEIGAPVDKSMTDADRKEVLEMAYDMYRKVPQMDLFGVVRLYEYAVLFDLVTPDAFQGFRDIAKAKMVASTYMQVSAIGHTNRTGEKVELQTRLDELNGDKPVTVHTLDMVIIRAKDIVVRKLFSDLVAAGKETIFESLT